MYYPEISITIPCYEMNNLGVYFLEQCLNSIKIQKFTNYEVVISDHSINNEIQQICNKLSNDLNIRYFKNICNRGSSSNNINNAIKNSNGKLIKVLCQDDYLYDENSLEKIVNTFDAEWLVSAYIHKQINDDKLFNIHMPTISDDILFRNRIGTHSCLTIRNNNELFFDENLIWYMDCEYYKQLYLKYGMPSILNDITMVQTLWSGQVTNTLANQQIRNNEYQYLKQKYKT